MPDVQARPPRPGGDTCQRVDLRQGEYNERITQCFLTGIVSRLRFKAALKN